MAFVLYVEKYLCQAHNLKVAGSNPAPATKVLMNKISFIFPVYNEEKRLSKINFFISWLNKHKIKQYEILIISNG